MNVDVLREHIALKLAPWLYLPRGGTGDVQRREELEHALGSLAEVAYKSRDAIWTSHRTLVRSALQQAEITGRLQRVHKSSAVSSPEDGESTTADTPPGFGEAPSGGPGATTSAAPPLGELAADALGSATPKDGGSRATIFGWHS